MSIILANQVSRLSKVLKKQGKKIVVVGGCFDILHPGHIIFLEQAKRAGDSLLVLLESDARVRRLKGIGRPVHNQKQRALVLSALKTVDHIIMLPDMKRNEDYDQLITLIAPDVIAATAGDENNAYRKRAAKLAGAIFKIVTKIIGNHSTSALLSRR